jgi:peptide/nickel transport system ATP-binding protein
LGVVARYAERIYVMYSGRIVESGFSEDIFENPQHPYTIGLLNCVPRLGETRKRRKLVPIVGLPPNLINMPQHCAFFPRCSSRIETCKQEPWPVLRPVGNQHYISCFVNGQEKQ